MDVRALDQPTIDAKEIRDTADHNGDAVPAIGVWKCSVAWANGLNQDASLQIQGSWDKDFSKAFNIGTAETATTGTNSYKEVTSYFPFYRVVATCSVAPATGSLTVKILGVG